MTRNLLRAGALSCALLTSTCLTPSAALAQTSTAQIHRAPDANGVDLTHGDFLLNMVEGSIGSGEAELALVRTGMSNPAASQNQSHSWDQLSLTAYVGANGTPSSFTVVHDSSPWVIKLSLSV